MHREVRMTEVKEECGCGWARKGKKRIAAQLGLDVKTVRRYVRGAEKAGLRVGRDGQQIADEVIASILETVRASAPREHGEPWARCEQWSWRCHGGRPGGLGKASYTEGHSRRSVKGAEEVVRNRAWPGTSAAARPNMPAPSTAAAPIGAARPTRSTPATRSDVELVVLSSEVVAWSFAQEPTGAVASQLWNSTARRCAARPSLVYTATDSIGSPSRRSKWRRLLVRSVRSCLSAVAPMSRSASAMSWPAARKRPRS